MANLYLVDQTEQKLDLFSTLALSSEKNYQGLSQTNESPHIQTQSQKTKIDLFQDNLSIDNLSNRGICQSNSEESSTNQNQDVRPQSQFQEQIQQEYLEPQVIKQKFKDIDFKINKATNAPKFLIKTFFDNIKQINEWLPVGKQGETHKKQLRKFEHNIANATKTRFHLLQLFGQREDEILNKRSMLNRKLLQRLLAQNKFELILSNNMIPSKNKVQYLYFSKVYEWRLNNPKLVGRFN